MKIKQILFSFKGTITRKQWWIYSSITFILLFWVIFPAIFISGIALVSPAMGKSKWTYIAGVLLGLSIYALPILALWYFLALNIKRLRERGRKWWLIIVLLILSYMFYMAALSVPTAIGDMVSSGDFYSLIICLVFFLIGLWPLIELGFLKGITEPDKASEK